MILDILVTANQCSKKLCSFTEALLKVLQNTDAVLDVPNHRTLKDLRLLNTTPSYSGEATTIQKSRTLLNSGPLEFINSGVFPLNHTSSFRLLSSKTLIPLLILQD